MDVGAATIEILNIANWLYALLQPITSGSITAAQPLQKSNSSNALMNYLVRIIAKRQHDCRIPNIHDFWKRRAFRAVKDRDWDLVVTTYAPPVTHAIGYALRKRGHARFWVADYRDLWLEHTIAPGTFPFTIIERFLEARYVKRADLLTTVSEPLAQVLRMKYPGKPVEVITNGFDSEEVESLNPERIFAEDSINIVYTGSIYQGKRDPAPLFTAIARLAADDYLGKLLAGFKVVFAGGSKDQVEMMARDYGVSSWVRHVGMVSRDEALRMQRDAHALIFMEWGECELDGVLTGKLFEYLCSGTEIWALGIKSSSAAGQLVSAAKAGKVFCNDVEAVYLALTELLMERKKREIHVDNTLLKQFDRETIAERLLELALTSIAARG